MDKPPNIITALRNIGNNGSFIISTTEDGIINYRHIKDPPVGRGKGGVMADTPLDVKSTSIMNWDTFERFLDHFDLFARFKAEYEKLSQSTKTNQRLITLDQNGQ